MSPSCVQDQKKVLHNAEERIYNNNGHLKHLQVHHDCGLLFSATWHHG